CGSVIRTLSAASCPNPPAQPPCRQSPRSWQDGSPSELRGEGTRREHIRPQADQPLTLRLTRLSNEWSGTPCGRPRIATADGSERRGPMSWGCRYVLPWREMDLPAIEAATRHALARMPPRPRPSKLEVRGPNNVRWFVGVFPDEERRWTVFGADQV